MQQIRFVELSSVFGFISELERQQIHEYTMDYALEKVEERGEQSDIEKGINKSKIEMVGNLNQVCHHVKKG